MSQIIAKTLVVCLMTSSSALNLKSENHMMVADGWEDSYLSEAIVNKEMKQKVEPEEKSASAIEAKFAKTKLNAKIDQMKEEMLLFSKTLERDHLA